jgi:hypothetical protein
VTSDDICGHRARRDNHERDVRSDVSNVDSNGGVHDACGEIINSRRDGSRTESDISDRKGLNRLAARDHGDVLCCPPDALRNEPSRLLSECLSMLNGNALLHPANLHLVHSTIVANGGIVSKPDNRVRQSLSTPRFSQVGSMTSCC